MGAGSSEPVVRVLVGGVHWCSFPGLCFRLVASGQPFLQCSLRTSLGSCLVEALATWQLSRQLTQNRVHTSSPNLSRQMLAALHGVCRNYLLLCDSPVTSLLWALPPGAGQTT